MQTRKEFYCVAFFFLFSAVALWMLLNRKPTAITKCKPRLHAKHGWAKHCCWNYFRCSITTNQLQIMCQRLQACFWKKCKATQQCGALTTWKMVFISIRSNKFHVHIILAAALHERLQSSKKAKNERFAKKQLLFRFFDQLYLDS